MTWISKGWTPVDAIVPAVFPETPAVLVGNQTSPYWAVSLWQAHRVPTHGWMDAFGIPGRALQFSRAPGENSPVIFSERAQEKASLVNPNLLAEAQQAIAYRRAQAHESLGLKLSPLDAVQARAALDGWMGGTPRQAQPGKPAAYELLVEEDRLNLNFQAERTLARILYIDSWPLEVEKDALVSFLPPQIGWSLSFDALSAQAVMRKLRYSVARQQEKLDRAEHRLEHPDYSLIQRQEDSIQLLDMLQRGETKAWHVSALLMVTADSVSQLNQRTEELERLLDSRNYRSRRGEFRQLHLLEAALPLAKSEPGPLNPTSNGEALGRAAREQARKLLSQVTGDSAPMRVGRNMHTQAAEFLLPQIDEEGPEAIRVRLSPDAF